MGFLGALGGGVLFLALASAGIVKVLRARDDAGGIWLPAQVGASRSRILGAVVGSIEVVLACWVVLVPSHLAYGVVVVSLALMTVYGLASVVATGQCSCGGMLHTTTSGSLLTRNAVLVGIALVLAIPDVAPPSVLESVFGTVVTSIVGLGVVGARRGMMTWM